MKDLMLYTIIKNIVRKTSATYQLVSLSAVQLKKIFAIFLVAAIFFNGFVPENAEFKSNFMQAINCAVETHANFLDKYAESIVNVTNGIANNIIGALNIAGLAGEKISNEKQTTNKNEQKSEPLNTSADNCIITGNNTNNQSEINILKAKTLGLAYTDISNEQLQYYSEELVSRNDKNASIGILFFILFSILVVRIKDTIAVINNNKNIVTSRLG